MLTSVCPALMSDAASVLDRIGRYGEVIVAALATSDENLLVLVVSDNLYGAEVFRVRRYRRGECEAGSVIAHGTYPAMFARASTLLVA